MAFRVLPKTQSSITVLIRSDNSTAISYIHRMGSVQHPTLTHLARTIWQWCEERDIWLYASYVSSVSNYLAHFESRRLPDDTEWSLSSSAFTQIITKYGPPELDLFASYGNAKCRTYISWRPDPESVAVDAFTISWSNHRFYAFPPFSLILRALNKIIRDKAEGIVVVPQWPAQPWYPLFTDLIEGEPLILDSDPLLLISPYSGTPCPMKITLVAAKLSAKRLPPGVLRAM